MPINWKLRSTVFNLLVAVYAEFGEEAFKGRYASIAKFFGPDASYDAIKSFFAKEIAKAAGRLKAQNPGYHGSGRGIPLRCSAGPSRRPHLYFDDQDISVLTQREAEAIEARIGNSRRAPAKRPRVIKASPQLPIDPEILCAALASNVRPRELSLEEVAAAQQVTIADNTETTARSSIQVEELQTAPGRSENSRKRPFSEIEDSVEAEGADTVRARTPPHFESFGYVTNQGQYRCALCLSQLPNQEDLDRHEQISKEHLRNLSIALKVSKGRAKLAQVTAVPDVGRHHNTPMPLQHVSAQNVHQNEHSQAQRVDLERDFESSNLTDGVRAAVNGPPSDTIEVRGRSVSSASIQPSSIGMDPLATFSVDTGCATEKGKARAISLTSSSPFPLPPPPAKQPARSNIIAQPMHLPTPSLPPSTPETRPTTARTEIGTLNTPHMVRHAFTQPELQHAQEILRQKAATSTTAAGDAKPPPAFSPTDLADIMRSTELIVQLMGCVQREAKAVAETHSVGDESFDSGVALDPGHAASKDGYEVQARTHGGSSLSDSQGSQRRSNTYAPQATVSAPGIDVYTNMRREVVNANGKEKGKRRRKDAGSEVSFIVLE